jgi:lipid A 4'-phosphatase
MNRTGLKIALAIAALIGIVFAIFPSFDLDISALFRDRDYPSFQFLINAQPWVQHSRWAARILITVLALPGFVAIFGKLILPHRRMLMSGRGAVLLAVTIALGPGLVTNVILKDHWGRARPIDVQQLGGTDRFTPWWDPRGDCPNNCSFVAGEPSGAFWTLAPASLAPLELQPLAYGAAVVFGLAIGVLRIGAGAHFFTDVVFAGVFMYLVIWAVHGFLYRWRATQLSDEAIERWLAGAGEGLAAMTAKLAARLMQRLRSRGGSKA